MMDTHPQRGQAMKGTTYRITVTNETTGIDVRSYGGVNADIVERLVALLDGSLDLAAKAGALRRAIEAFKSIGPGTK